MIKRAVAQINEELIVFVLQLKSNLFFCFVVLGCGVTAWIVANELPPVTLTALLGDVATAILGLLTIFITAAIFMATLSSQATTKAADESAEFVATLHETEHVFRRAYMATRGLTTADQKWRLAQAVAAESVLDQSGYRKFRNWLSEIRSDFDGSYYQQNVLFPYDVAQVAVSNRSWSIKSGIALLEDELDMPPDLRMQVVSAHTKSFTKLNAAASSYELTGIANAYNQRPFLGQRLTRVVFYGAVAVVVINLYRAFSSKTFDLIPQIDFHAAFLVKAVVSLLVLGVLALCLRYLVLLVAYFRYSSPYPYQANTSFYYEYPTETNNAYGGYWGGARG